MCIRDRLISYSLLCKWFRVAVLPADRLLYAELYQTGDLSLIHISGKANVKKLYSPKTGKTYDGSGVLADTGGKYVNYRVELPKKK